MASDHLFEGRPLQKLHDDVGPAEVLAEIMDRADVGVIESRGGARFSLEPFQSRRVLSDLKGQKLDRDRAPEANVLGAEELAYASGADLLGNAIMPYSLAEQPSPL